VRVYAGNSGDVSHGHGSDWPMWLLEVSMQSGATLVQEVPQEHRGFVYILGGRARIGGKDLKQGDVAWCPFVMNTRQEIQQAFHDYQAGRLVT